MGKSNKIYAYVRWLMPDPVNILVYSTIIILTFILSNGDNIQRLLRYSESLHIKSGILSAISNSLDRFLPQDLAADFAVAIFWAFIGLIVYLLIIFVANFTSELGDDLAVDKYVYPSGADKYARFKRFALVHIERITGIVILVVLLRVILNELLPQWAGVYQQTITNWPLDLDAAMKLLLSLIAEFFVLHTLVILARLILLRKRVLGL